MMGIVAMTVRKIAPASVMRLMRLVQIIARALPRTHAGNVAAVFLQVIGDLQFVDTIATQK